LDGQFNTIATYGLNMLALATEVLFSRDGILVLVFKSEQKPVCVGC